MGPLLPGTRHVVLAFDAQSVRRPRGAGEAQQFAQQVQTPFLPKGLMIWGATRDTFVQGVKVGNVSELEIGGYASIPGLYFEQGRSFEDILRLADAGELELSVQARQQLEMSEAAPGVMVSVTLSGPYERFCLWGVTYVTGGPHRRARVEALSDTLSFAGRIDELTLSGVRTVLEVTAPTAQIATELLVGLEASRRSARGY